MSGLGWHLEELSSVGFGDLGKGMPEVRYSHLIDLFSRFQTLS